MRMRNGGSGWVKGKKILWVTPSCLLDVSNGAAITSREILHRLHALGYRVSILTATIMDSPTGDAFFSRTIVELIGEAAYAKFGDGPLGHLIVKTASHRRDAMTSAEESAFFSLYVSVMDEIDPDIVMTFGGMILDMQISDEARRRGKKTVGFLYNGHFEGHRWHRDLDHVITESEATARLYKERLDLDVTVIGSVVERQRFIAKSGPRDSLLFVTPTVSKGALIVAALAWLLERMAPQIKIIVVQGRGKWLEITDAFFKAIGEPERLFSNVELINSTRDMAAIYGRTRLLLAPSLWYESLGRVIIEAMWNGIPALVTDRNGPKEVVGRSGLRINLSDEYFKPPYTYLQKPEAFENLARQIIDLFQDDDLYRKCSDTALAEAGRLHDASTNIGRLIAVIDPDRQASISGCR